MKKKIVADLTSLAHRILQLKDREDIHELQSMAKELYEKLTVMVFTEKHFSDVKPTAGNREVEQKLEEAFADAQQDIQTVSQDVESVMEQAQNEVKDAFANNDLSDLFISENDEREEIELPGISTIQKMVVEMPDEVPSTSELKNKASDHIEKEIKSAEDERRDSYSTTTNSLTDLFVPEENTREQMDLPGIATIQEMMTEMPAEAPEVPKPAEKIYHDVKKLKEKELEKERQSYTTNSLTHLVVPEEDERDGMDLPGISTIQKMVEEMPDEVTENAKPREPKTHSTTNLEQLTADFQTMPVFERKAANQESDRPQSLNSKLNTGLKIGMNDRMGFVKNLFNGNNQDFNRVVSQLNTIDSYSDAQNFIQQMIKPDYNNWEGKESFESRFMDLIERKYQ